jgi:hypothetical protein
VAGYGVYFSNNDLTRFSVFADLPPANSAHDTGEDLPPYVIGKGYQISNYCGIISPTILSCKSGGVGGGSQITSLTVFFKRPNSDAIFSSSAGSGETYTSAYIQVKSNGNNDTRAIKVTNTGQIMVCPLNVNPPTC